MLPIPCRCRTWTTASFPNGTRSWSWMRREGKGGSKGSHGGLGVLVSQSWGVTQGRVQLGWEPGGGKLPHHWHPVQPPDLLGGVRHCPWLLTFPPSCSPGGTSSASGSRESCSGCSSECTKGKGFRSRNLKLPHFSLSQMMVRLGEGVSGLGVQTRGGGLTLSLVSPQWKVCSSPLTCP